MVDGRNWYDSQTSRRYPLEDGVSGEGNNGVELPIEFLADLRVVFPASTGSRARLGSAKSNSRIVTLTVVSDLGVPLAAYSTTQASAIRGRAQTLVPLHPGVSGWVVLGERTEDFEVGFSSDHESLLAIRAAIPYRDRDVTGMGKLGGQLLTLIPELRGTDEVEIVADDRVIDGKVERCIVVKLVGGNGPGSALAKYRGTCTGRPESRTCNPPAIEMINSVSPGPDGVIEIELQPEGFWHLYETNLDNTLVVESEAIFGEACPTPKIPDTSGNLPYDQEADCSGQYPAPTLGIPFLKDFTTPDPNPMGTLLGRVEWDQVSSNLVVVEADFCQGRPQPIAAAHVFVHSQTGEDTEALWRDYLDTLPPNVGAAMMSSRGSRSVGVRAWPDTNLYSGGFAAGVIFGMKPAAGGTGLGYHLAGVDLSGTITAEVWDGDNVLRYHTGSTGWTLNPATHTRIHVFFEGPHLWIRVMNDGRDWSSPAGITVPPISGISNIQSSELGYGCWGVKGVRLDNFYVSDSVNPHPSG